MFFPLRQRRGNTDQGRGHRLRRGATAWRAVIDAGINDAPPQTPEEDITSGPTWVCALCLEPRRDPAFQSPVRAELASYAKEHFRMGGIRKPRLGNTGLLQEAAAKGYLLPGDEVSSSSAATVGTWRGVS